MKKKNELDWERFYFPETLTLESEQSQNPSKQARAGFPTWATIRREVLQEQGTRSLIKKLVDPSITPSDKYELLLRLQEKGMSRFPSLTGLDWDYYKVRTTMCILYLRAAGVIPIPPNREEVYDLDTEEIDSTNQ